MAQKQTQALEGNEAIRLWLPSHITTELRSHVYAQCR